MINETIFNYETVHAINTNPVMIFVLIMIFSLTLLVYFLLGLRKARTGDGRKLNVRMIQKLNFWVVGFVVFGFEAILIIFGLIIPIWLKWLG